MNQDEGEEARMGETISEERMAEKYDDFMHVCRLLCDLIDGSWIDYFANLPRSIQEHVPVNSFFFVQFVVSFYFPNSLSIYSSTIELNWISIEIWKLITKTLTRSIEMMALCAVIQTAIGYYSVFFLFEYFIKYSKQ